MAAKRKAKKDRSKDRESNLREISNKYKMNAQNGGAAGGDSTTSGGAAGKVDPVEKLNKENEDEISSTTTTKKGRAAGARPDSGTSSINHSVARYPGSILHNRDPVYGYNRKEKKKVSLLVVCCCEYSL